VTLEGLLLSIADFNKWQHTDKVKLFAWFLHSTGKAYFQPGDINKCFDEAHIHGPKSISSVLIGLSNKSPKEVLRNASGYRLEKVVRDRFDAQYGTRPAAIHVDKILTDLLAKLTNPSQRTYLEESLLCFRMSAFRAAVVMCWNLSYDHLCQFVISDDGRLTNFNTQLPKTYPKADISSIAKRDDFTELKESQVLQVCKSALLISGSVHKIMKEKLDRRNIAAHPSGVGTFAPTAEEYIKDLVENVVLKLV
jgi:hypothetical protein